MNRDKYIQQLEETIMRLIAEKDAALGRIRELEVKNKQLFVSVLVVVVPNPFSSSFEGAAGLVPADTGIMLVSNVVSTIKHKNKLSAFFIIPLPCSFFFSASPV